MRAGRVLGLLVVVIFCLAPRIASACGEWTLFDVEKQYRIQYLINAGSVRKALAGGKAGGRVAVQSTPRTACA